MIALFVALIISQPVVEAEYVPRVVLCEVITHQPKTGVGQYHTTRSKSVQLQRRDWLGHWQIEEIAVEQWPDCERSGPYEMFKLKDRRIKTRAIYIKRREHRCSGMEGVR